MNMTREFIILLLSINGLVSMIAQIQPFRLIEFDREFGIPNETLYSITTDDHGVVWFNTQHGLYRFDGTFCERYPDLPDGYRNARFNTVFHDSQGWLWVGTKARGLLALDQSKDTVRSFQHDPGVPGMLSGNNINFVFEDSKGRIWISVHISGLDLFDRQGTSFAHYQPSRQFQSLDNRDIDQINDIVQDPGNPEVFWLGTLDGLLMFDAESGAFTHFSCQRENMTNPEDWNGLENSTINIFVRDSIIWFSTYGGGFCKFNIASGQFTSYKYEPFLPASQSKNTMRAMPSFTDNAFILSPVGHDLMLFDPASGQMEEVKNERVREWTKDKFGTIWLTGMNNSLFAYFPGAQFMKKYPLAQNIHKCVMTDGCQTLYAASREHSVYRINLHKNTVENYVVAGQEEYGYNFVKNIFPVSTDQSTLVSLFNLFTISHTSGNIRRSYDFPEALLDFLCSVNHPKDIVWLGNKKDLYRVDLTEHDYRILSTGDGLVHSDWIQALAADHMGFIWYGTEKGFGVVDTEGNPIFDSERITEIPAEGAVESISGICHDASGRIWLSDYNLGIGVLGWDGKKAHYQARFTDQNSNLNSSKITDMICDKQGNIWVITERGLSRVFTTDMTVENYGREYGLEKMFQFSADTCGQIYIGGEKGFYMFDPAQAKKAQDSITVVIRSMSVFDQPWKGEKHIAYTDTVQLSYKQSFFTLGLTAVRTFSSEPLEYAYKMEGLHNQWISLGIRDFVGFTKLGGGTYHFLARARAGKGKWSEPAQLTFVISPPFWKTAWFYLLCGITLFGILFGLYQYRIRQVRKEEKLLADFNKALAETEMSALRAQMNPHFLFNCLNSIKMFTIENNVDAAAKYLTKFSRLIRLILQNSKTPKIKLSDELEALELYMDMESMRFDHRFSYAINCKDVPVERLEVPPLVLQPFVENAIWHGLMHKDGHGHLDVSIELEDGHLRCSIKDDGIGIAASQKLKEGSSERKKSYGMSITRDRLSLIKKLYDVDTRIHVEDLQENGHARGTRVTIHIPLMYTT